MQKMDKIHDHSGLKIGAFTMVTVKDGAFVPFASN